MSKHHHTFINPIARILFFLSIELLSTVGGFSQKPIAQYPLFVHEFKRKYLYLNYWDVSGNGNHGHSYHAEANTGPAGGGSPGLYYENEPNSTSFKLRKGFFFESGVNDSIPCLKKDTEVESFVTIPDPLNGKLYTDSFSVSLWVNPVSTTAQMDIYVSNAISIRSNVNILEVGLNWGSTSTQKTYTHQSAILAQAWQHVLVSVVAGEVIAYIGSQKYTLSEAGTRTYPNIQNSKAQILSTAFGGEVFNFRFYKTKFISTASINQDLNFLHRTFHSTTGDTIGARYVVDDAVAYYPLNGKSASEWVKNKKGSDAISTNGSLASVSDRFNAANGAVDFSGASANMKIASSTHNLFGTYLDNYRPFNEPQTPDANGNCGNFTSPKGISFSFWVKIGTNYSAVQSIDSYVSPYSSTDAQYNIFSGMNDDASVKYYGMQWINDRLGLHRVTRIAGKSIDPWFLWCYDPINFTQATGWYHIILSQDMDWLRIFMFKPTSETAPKPIIQSLYMELDRLDEITQWIIGSNKTTQGPGPIDDFRVYNWPLYEYEAIALDRIERQGTVTEKSALVSSDSSANEQVKNHITVYPNPAKKVLNIKLLMSQKGSVHIHIFNSNGISTLKQTCTSDAGQYEWSTNIESYPKGIYFIQVVTPNQSYTEKVIIE